MTDIFAALDLVLLALAAGLVVVLLGAGIDWVAISMPHRRPTSTRRNAP